MPACPDPSTLRSFLLGDLAQDTVAELAAHTDTCGTCQRQMAELEPTLDLGLGTVREILRDATDAELDTPRDSVEIVERLLRIPDVDPTRSFEGSLPAVGGSPVGRLRHYELLEMLGRGGMGAVYKARDTNLDRLVAIKVLPQSRRHDPESTRRFQREFRALGRLDHPNVVRALNADEEQGVRFLVMDLISGVDLQRHVRDHGRLTTAKACDLVRQAALGLDFIHQNGLVHRDIKPSNLVLTESGQIKIVDLGLALLSQEGTEDGAPVDATTAARVMGTIDYMSPEQAQDSHAVDARADLYSLGCVLYFLLAGTAPFRTESRSALSSLVARLNEPAPRLRETLPNVAPELDDLVARLLARDAARRPQSAAEVARSLQEFLEQRDSTRESATSPQVSRTLAGRRPFVIAGVVALLLAFAGVLVFQTRHGEVTVLIDEDSKNDVQVTLASDETLRVIDAKSGWNVDVAPGEYRVRILGKSADQFELRNDRLVVTRHEKSRVEVLRKTIVKPAEKQGTVASPRPKELPAPPTIARRTDAPLIDKDFNQAEAGWPQNKNPDGESGFRDGRYFMRMDSAGDSYFAWGVWPVETWPTDIEVTGRATGSPRAGWGLQWWGPSQPELILQTKMMDLGRRLDVVLLTVDPKASTLTILRRDVLGSWPLQGRGEKEGEFRRLRVLLYENELIVQVDDVFVGRHRGKLGRFGMHLVAYQGDGPMVAEFDQVKAWRATER